MKLRSLHSFLISLNAHVWGLVLLSLLFVYEQKPPEPQRIEVQFLKLPAPLEGNSINNSPKAIRSETAVDIALPEATGAKARAEVSIGKSARPSDRPQERVHKRRGPRVEYRVRVAKTTSPVTAREAGTWTPASRIRLRKSAVHNTGSRIAGVSPDIPPAVDRRPSFSGDRSTSGDQRSQNPVDASGNRSTSGDQWPNNIDGAPAGDTRELIKIIQARIDAVTPLVHASAGPCQSTRGVVHLKFVVNQAGYPGGFRIISSSGVRCLDDEVDNVLHMAEPYPYVAGWIPVTVRFAPRTSI
jgi:outer membrane biosynthesis protein TonB